MKRRRSGKPKVQAGPSKPAEGPKNPMVLFTVLSHLFKVIAFDLKDFRNFRLVCKDWTEASIRRWRQEVWLPLRDSPSNSNDDDDDERSQELTSLSLDKFLQFMNDPEDPLEFLSPTNHFRKYKVSFSEDLCFGSPGRLEFCSRMGPNMNKLQIIHSNISSSEDFARIIFELTPNLSSFEFQSSDYPQELELPYPFNNPESELVEIPVWDESVRPVETKKELKNLVMDLRRRPFALSWSYFLARLPNIKKLTIKAFSENVWHTEDNREHPTEQRLFFETLLIVRGQMGPEYFAQLEELNLVDMAMHPVDKLPLFLLSTLRELNFPLKCLEIDIGYSQNVQGFKTLLEIYSNTLEKLTVYRAPHYSPFSLDFPYGVNLPRLKELRFIGPIVRNLKFLVNCVNLTDLELSSDCYKINRTLEVRPGVDVIGNTKFLSPALKRLVMNELDGFIVQTGAMICNAERVKALGKLFPNLKALGLGLKDDSFAMVCKTWEQLEELYVRPNELTEKGILGKVGRQIYQEPNVTHLKELKILTMGYPLQNSSKGRLTTDSILHGLLVCPSLKGMDLCVAPQASQLAQDRLASKCSFGLYIRN